VPVELVVLLGRPEALAQLVLHAATAAETAAPAWDLRWADAPPKQADGSTQAAAACPCRKQRCARAPPLQANSGAQAERRRLPTLATGRTGLRRSITILYIN
jgi:hypothetical protein